MEEFRPRSTGELRGLTVVSTRPRGQGAALRERLLAAGASVVDRPGVEIRPPRDRLGAAQALARLDEAVAVLFTSRNAVDGLFDDPSFAPGDLVARLSLRPVGAIGDATSDRLRRRGIRVEIRPSAGADRRFDSEALLRHPALADAAIRGRRLVLVRGEGGRRFLERALLARGAEVSNAVVYRRDRPEIADDERRRILALPEPLAVIVTSLESFENIEAMLGPAWAARCTFIVVSERIARAVRGRIRAAVVAARASDDEIVAALLRWWTREARGGGRC